MGVLMIGRVDWKLPSLYRSRQGDAEAPLRRWSLANPHLLPSATLARGAQPRLPTYATLALFAGTRQRAGIEPDDAGAGRACRARATSRLEYQAPGDMSRWPQPLLGAPRSG